MYVFFFTKLTPLISTKISLPIITGTIFPFFLLYMINQ